MDFRTPTLSRHQAVLFTTSLDDAIPENHMVRVLDKILGSKPFEETFEAWEGAVRQREGRPAYRPRSLAGVVIYGMLVRIRSSRQLEDACHNRIDFRWLAECQTPDHSTINRFVKKNMPQIRKLFRASVKLALDVGVLNSSHLAVDGTRVRANASCESVMSREKIEGMKKVIEHFLDHWEEEWKESEKRDLERLGNLGAWTVVENSPEFQKKAVAWHARLDKALVELSKRTESAPRPKAVVQRISVTDPESRIQKAKRSKDVAPHYSPQIVVDVESGIVVAEEVVNEATDRGQLLPMTQQAVENTGVVPATMSGDSGYSDGRDVKALEDLGIDAYVPEQGNKGPKAQAKRTDALNALRRGEDLTEDQWTAITGKSTKKKARRLPTEAFEYDRERDVYICPMGVTLPYVRTVTYKTKAGLNRSRSYGRCKACLTCSIRNRCITSQSTTRWISRSEYKDCQERIRDRLNSEEGWKLYNRRTPSVEGAFGDEKHNQGFRRFTRRTLRGVQLEWSLQMLGRNLRKLLARAPEVVTCLRQ